MDRSRIQKAGSKHQKVSNSKTVRTLLRSDMVGHSFVTRGEIVETTQGLHPRHQSRNTDFMVINNYPVFPSDQVNNAYSIERITTTKKMYLQTTTYKHNI